MGARADGWWRDRAGAAVRLCNDVAALSGGGRASGDAGRRHWVMVLEGGARAAVTDPALDLMDPEAAVTLVLARGSGDDTMARIAAELGKWCTVVTADRELRRRCERAGAGVAGPRWLLALL
jgi:8-oxo-dGTP diphosphatase